MKKLFSVFTAMVMAAWLVGCGAADESSSTPAPATPHRRHRAQPAAAHCKRPARPAAPAEASDLRLGGPSFADAPRKAASAQTCATTAPRSAQGHLAAGQRLSATARRSSDRALRYDRQSGAISACEPSWPLRRHFQGSIFWPWQSPVRAASRKSDSARVGWPLRTGNASRSVARSGFSARRWLGAPGGPFKRWH